MNLANKLLDFKEKIEEAKIQKAQIEGKLENSRDQLRDLCGQEDIEEAKKITEKLSIKIETIEKELKEKIEDIESYLSPEDIEK